jgi:hypothetical protein
LIERETIDREELEVMMRGEELPPVSKMALEAIKSIRLNKEEKTNTETNDNNKETIK